ncbi:MAG TPA: PEP-CTERM sorting domain-containing protein [Pirellulales bacterium]|jgi:hypothetical protein|nr:PEP-CTERM sorting domain-containing protein [Pirellulales bacterium]
MNRVTPFFAFVVFCAIGGAVRAVHLDVWVHKDIVNRVDSGYFDVNAGVPITPMDRALGWGFQEFDQDPYYANNPGYFAESNTNPGGSQLPGGSLVGFNLLSDLQYWDGNGPVSFGPVPAGETLSINYGSNTVVVGTGTGAQPGFTLAQVASGTAEGFLHIHVNANIGAPNGVPTDGIYIFREQLTSNAQGVINSLPFWIVFNNNISEDQRGEAINFLYPNQWCGPLGGSYNTDANWSGTIPLPGQIVPVPQSPNGQDTVANLLDNLYADSTITIDSPTTVGIINFSSVPRYTLGGSASLTLQSGSTAQINLKLGNHTIAAPLIIASNTVVAAGTNSLNLQGAQTWNDNTTLTLQSGTLNYSIANGPTTVGANVQLAIATGAGVNVNGTVNPFADAGHRVSIANDSATGLNINAAGIRVGRITGGGATAVAAGSQLTADSIIQGALMIGGTASNPGLVTIDASDSLGNPLADGGLVLAGSLLSGTSFASEINSTELGVIGTSSDSPTVLPGAGLSGLDSASNVPSVPEPSSWLLAVFGVASCGWLARRRTRSD